MAFQISRLYDFAPGTKAASGQVDAELNQLVAAHNGTDKALTDYIALLVSALGAAEIGTKGNKTLASAIVSDDIGYARINEDNAIEISLNGIDWVITGSSGHLIYDKDGNLITQRSRMKFANSVVTDDGTYTIVNGIKGDTGVAGAQGIQGIQGEQGLQGDTGNSIIPSVDQATGLMSFSEGVQGVVPASVNVKGPQGSQGVQGIQGIAGVQGAQGAQGPQGIQGPLGPVGTQGLQGLQGPRGLQGNEGPQGTRGLKGDTGDKGDKGDTGLTGAQGGTGTQGPLGPQGLKGDQGANGTSFAIKGIYTTLLALQTAHPTGATGDAYAVGTEISNIIYNWSVDTSNWVSLGSLQGPQGPQGIQGVQGEQGIQGTTGATGETGSQGIQGIQGVTGKGYYPQGAWALTIPYVCSDTQIDTVYLNGNSYYCKVSHTATVDNTPPNTTYWGIMALKGDTGDEGPQGIQGEQGLQGIQGIQGIQGEPTNVNSITAVEGNITLGAVNIPVTDTGAHFTSENVEGALSELFQYANDGKTSIAAAITAKGIAASVADTFSALATKIATAALVLTSSATAIASQMLSGVTAYVNGTKITGTIPSKSAATITPGTTNQVIAAGQYLSGDQTIAGDADLVSANIKSGANIFGVAGNANVVDTSAGDATAAQILSGKKAYVDGMLVTGTIPSKGAVTITPGTTNQTIAAGQYLSDIQTIAGSANLVAGNIKSGVNIFGVVGTVKERLAFDSSKIHMYMGSSDTAATIQNSAYVSFSANTPVIINGFLMHYDGFSSSYITTLNSNETFYYTKGGSTWYSGTSASITGTVNEIMIFNPNKANITLLSTSYSGMVFSIIE